MKKFLILISALIFVLTALENSSYATAYPVLYFPVASKDYGAKKHENGENVKLKDWRHVSESEAHKDYHVWGKTSRV